MTESYPSTHLQEMIQLTWQRIAFCDIRTEVIEKFYQSYFNVTEENHNISQVFEPEEKDIIMLLLYHDPQSSRYITEVYEDAFKNRNLSNLDQWIAIKDGLAGALFVRQDQTV